MFLKLAENINQYLETQNILDTKIQFKSLEMMYSSEYVLAISECDYINVFEVEGIDDYGMCRWHRKGCSSQLKGLDVGFFTSKIIEELQNIWQSNNVNFRFKQLEKQVDFNTIINTSKLILLATLNINTIPFYLSFPTKMSALL